MIAAESETCSGVDWHRVMDLSEQMLLSARAADWDSVSRLQEERLGLIRQYFAAEPASDNLDRIRPQVNRLLDMDAEVAALSDAARRHIADTLRGLRKGKVVKKAYRG